MLSKCMYIRISYINVTFVYRHEYSSLSNNKRSINEVQSGTSNHVIPGPMPDELVTPINGVGKRLLQVMGWRDGQGVGPRVSKKEDGREYTVGAANVNIINTSGSGMQVKDDVFGLGYDASKEAPEMSMYRSRSRVNVGSQGNKRLLLGDVMKDKVNRSNSFGIGALEDAGTYICMPLRLY